MTPWFTVHIHRWSSSGTDRAATLYSMSRSAGFTLVEIMIVVAIIALLAAIATPAFLRARQRAQNTRFINDMRVAAHAFEMYAADYGDYPVNKAPGLVPDGMDLYLKGMEWTSPTPIGGSWDWQRNRNNKTVGVSVYQTPASDEQMTEIDAKIDDGDVSTGIFQARGPRYVYLME
jgi:prepilin-type N-terminal cleavage/methylation domain-containing protein